MIKSIALTNYQGHKQSELEFVPGLNVIAGASDQGKSSILRAINAVVNNKMPKATNSWWNRDKKGEYVESECIVIGLDSKLEDHIVRYRSKKDNNYVIDNKASEQNIFEAVKTEVPEQIASLLNMSEINIQKQFDAPYLLSESAAEVARSFNKVIKLDIIDKVLSNAERERQRNNAILTQLEVDIKDSKEQIQAFDWLEQAQNIIGKVKCREDKIKEKEDKSINLNLLMNKHCEYKESLDKLPCNVKEVEELMSEIQTLEREIEVQEEDYDILNGLLIDYVGLKKEQDRLNKVNIEKALQLISGIDKLQDEKEKKEDNWHVLYDLIASYRDENAWLKKYNKELIESEKQMPEQCPVCSAPLKGGKDVHGDCN